MCGLTGAFYLTGSPQREVIERMTTALSHRGPDAAGYKFFDQIAFGHRRLSIIDLSDRGLEPLPNEDKTVWVVFNGEIYNFRALRSELIAKGHQFFSATDTEVIVHAYEEWGIDAIKHFVGMFAFALWDERAKRLWLARDHFGVKPMFYSILPNGIAFGSEIKAILQHPGVQRDLDFQALEYFLSLNYMPAPHTLFAQIRQLEPGQYLTVDSSGDVEIRAYWKLAFEEQVFSGEHEIVEEFRCLLEDSVRQQLVSDVPLGAFLSGGLDSSSIAYLANQHTSEPLKTFTVAFKEKEFDESRYAKKVAAHIGTDHSEIEVTPDLTSVLPKIVWHAEEPTANSSMLSVYYLAKFTRERVTVALSGDGSDEINAGYQTYQAYKVHQLFSRLPRWLRQGVLLPAVDMLPVSEGKVSTEFKLKRFVRSGELSAAQAHASWRMIFGSEERRRLLAPAVDRLTGNRDVGDIFTSLFAEAGTQDPLHRMLYSDIRFYLPNDSLAKVDRMSMAHGLEVRVPFLDHRLVEFLARVPSHMKIKRGQKKYLLKEAMRGRLPSDIIYRNKAGFNLPHARWLRNELRPFVTDHLSASRVRAMNFLDANEVSQVIQQHLRMEKDNSHQIWCLLSLSLWWQQFIEQNGTV
ncbi:MAG: asparagine synthase (glutamine-hydrolyzing) [Anaerolineales bacterium]|nr:asparagine synthase (glutamine-hydrolyzing) [Anaerolineales bacterium]